jgi:hypothetical protein
MAHMNKAQWTCITVMKKKAAAAKMRAVRLIIIAVIVGTFSLLCGAVDWPQFRGPQRSGVSLERGLVKEWPKGGAEAFVATEGYWVRLHFLCGWTVVPVR